jgi:hypothetical protein
VSFNVFPHPWTGSDTDLRWGSKTVADITSVRFLGLHLEPDWSWTVQMPSPCKMAAKLYQTSGLSCAAHTLTLMSNFSSSRPELFVRCGLAWKCGSRAPRTRNGEWHAWTVYWWMSSKNRSASPGRTLLYAILDAILKHRVSSVFLASYHEHRRRNCGCSLSPCSGSPCWPSHHPPLLRFFPFYRSTTLGGYTFNLSWPGCTRDWRS